MGEIYLGLGTNLGNRKQNLDEAITSLQNKVEINKISPIYETKAWGYENQPDFLNLCIYGKTNLEPYDLLVFIKELEADLGRRSTFHWGPRIIDIDILFYGDLVLDLPDLVIPHQRLAERAFVLIPLADIAPNFRDPVSGKKIKDMAKKLESGGVRLYR